MRPRRPARVEASEPEVTVSMPARNSAGFIAQAMRSVLDQQGIELELVVVDDASADGTLAAARAFHDPRVRILHNATRRGIGASHNRVLGVARGPFIAHVDSDDFLLPGALQKLVAAMRSDPSVGQAHCWFFDVGADGRLSEARREQRRAWFAEQRPPGLDYRATLPRIGGVVNHLRTYPRELLASLGGFDEGLRFGVDYDMALRILEHRELRLVPEFLYMRRVHGRNTSIAMPFLRPRMWWQKAYIRRRLVRRGAVTYLPRRGAGFVRGSRSSSC